MILIGQYDSPFVRRVAIALRFYGLPFELPVSTTVMLRSIAEIARSEQPKHGLRRHGGHEPKLTTP